jgi:hypothetical protein
VPVKRDAGRDRRDEECKASKAAQHSEVAQDDVLAEVLHELRAGPPLRGGESVDVVGEDAVPDSLEGLVRAVEDRIGHQCDAGNAGGGSFDPP